MHTHTHMHDLTDLTLIRMHDAQDKPKISATEGLRASDQEAMNRLANISLAGDEEDEDKTNQRANRPRQGNHNHANGYSNGGGKDAGFSPSRPANGFKRTDPSPRMAALSPEKAARGSRVKDDEGAKILVEGGDHKNKLASARLELEEAEQERYDLEMQRLAAEEEAVARRQIFQEEAARMEEDERLRAEEIEARKIAIQQDEAQLEQVPDQRPRHDRSRA